MIAIQTKRGIADSAAIPLRLALFTCLAMFGAHATASDEFWIVQEEGAALWTVTDSGASTVASTPNLSGIRSAAVSPDDGSVWMFDGQRVLGFDRDGLGVAEIVIDGFRDGDPVGLHVDVAANRLWIADHNIVRGYTLAGVKTVESKLNASITATAYEPNSARLHVAAGKALTAFDASGMTAALALPKSVDVDALAFSADGSQLWVAGRKASWIYSFENSRFSDANLHSLDGRVLGVQPTDEHAWLIGLHAIASVDRDGRALQTLPIFPSEPMKAAGADGAVIAAAATGNLAVVLGDRSIALVDGSISYREISDVTGRQGRGLAVFALDSEDLEPPVASFVDPQDGDYRQSFSVVHVYAEDERSGIDYSGGVVKNSAGCEYTFSAALSTLPQAAAYVCEDTAPDGPLTITASIPDTAGNFSATSAVSVVVDTVPPHLDTAAVNIAINDDGTVTVTLPPGGAEPGARLVITTVRDGVEESYELFVNEDGSFELTVAAVPGDSVIVEAFDRAGNSSGESSFEIVESSMFVKIESPLAGSSVYGQTIDVQGRYDGPDNAGIVVNGVLASIGPNKRFLAPDVRVPEQGETLLTATLRAVDGLLDSHAVNVHVTHDSPSYVQLRPRLASGSAPLATSFFVMLSAEQYTSLSIDLDGDGTFETVAEPGDEIPYVYTEPGVYEITARAVVAGNEHFASERIVVTEPGAAAGMQSAWEGFNLSLLAGDVETAIHYISLEQRARYRPVLETIVTDYAAIQDSFLEVRLQEAHAHSGEYVLVREIDGVRKVFLVQFVRSMDGVWRISAI